MAKYFAAMLAVRATGLRGDEDSPSRELVLTAPFAAARANFFHAALEVPPLEPGRTLNPGSWLFRMRTTHARSNEERVLQGSKQDFDGIFHEWAHLEIAWGAQERLEIGARAAIAGWDEHEDRFEVFDSRGRPLVRFEDQTIFGKGASKRHDNLSVAGARAKVLVLRAEENLVDASLAVSAKFPVGRPRDLTNAGTHDLAATAMASLPLPWGAVHASCGATVPLGEQNLFIEEAGIDLQPFVHGGIGAVVSLPWTMALGLQVEANSSAFSEIPFLDGPPLNIAGGLRKLQGGLILEAGGGLGVNWENSYQYMVFGSIGYLWD